MRTTQIVGKISLSAVSLQGTRDDQQDFYISSQINDKTIAIVCDGMGGLEGGSVASRNAAEILLKDLENLPQGVDMQTFYKRELERLDDLIFGLRREDGTRLHAGTTVVSVMINGSELNWFSVGDSKMFYKRKKEVHCVTREHNYSMKLEELREQDKITPEKYVEESAKGEQLISYLGLGTAEIFDGNYSPFIMERGDRVLLCTDGLYRTLNTKEISSILIQRGTTERICKLLENALTAKNKQNQDNATWILLQKNN